MKRLAATNLNYRRVALGRRPPAARRPAATRLRYRRVEREDLTNRWLKDDLPRRIADLEFEAPGGNVARIGVDYVGGPDFSIYTNWLRAASPDDDAFRAEVIRHVNGAGPDAGAVRPTERRRG